MGSRASHRVIGGADEGLTADIVSSHAVTRNGVRVAGRTPLRIPLKGVVVFLVLAVLLAAFASSVQMPAKKARHLPASSESTVTLPMNLINQYRDTNMPCASDGVSCPPGGGAHAWNDVKGVDGIYGTPDDCPHCSCYCAPASVAMIAKYRGNVGVKIQQDVIYDNGKSVGELAVGDGILSTHGLGMFDGSGGMAIEVQTSYLWAIGAYTQHDWAPANPNGPMTPVKLVQYLAFGHPVLWLDHGGFPKNQSANYPPLSERLLEGHAKVISGYDDNGTLLNSSDDLCLIYDPWPEYLDMSILPTNATLGPGNSFDPYWLPLDDVNLSDPADIYLVDNFPDISEFQNVLVPLLGMSVLVVVCIGISHRTRREP
jgi:hypothetical protein